MRRRGFFKSLALMAGAASLSPTIFIPRFEPVRWKNVHALPDPVWNYKEFYGEWRFIVGTGLYEVVPKEEDGENRRDSEVGIETALGGMAIRPVFMRSGIEGVGNIRCTIDVVGT